MKTVILYGELAKRFGKHHSLDVQNVGEAVRALRANFRGFEQFLCGAHLDNVAFKVFVGGSSIDKDELNHPTGAGRVIRIVPVVMGGKSDFFKIITGVALIVGAVLLAPVTGGTSLSFLPTALGSMGLGMMIGGVAGLLTGAPPSPQQQEQTPTSHIFTGPENVSVQGRAVPVGYGRMIVGSCVISAGIETHEEYA